MTTTMTEEFSPSGRVGVQMLLGLSATPNTITNMSLAANMQLVM